MSKIDDLLELDTSVIAHTDVSDFATANQVVQSPESLRKRCIGIRNVALLETLFEILQSNYLVQIHVMSLQVLQTLIDSGSDVPPTESLCVDASKGIAPNFGSNDPIISLLCGEPSMWDIISNFERCLQNTYLPMTASDSL